MLYLNNIVVPRETVNNLTLPFDLYNICIERMFSVIISGLLTSLEKNKYYEYNQI